MVINGSGKRPKKGHLVLIGGREEKRGDITVLRRTFLLNNASKVIVIPSASNSYSADIGVEYAELFKELGAESTGVIDIKKRSDADDPMNIKKLDGADLIFFSGGDQVKLVELLWESKLINKVKKLYSQGATIAGTSAGAAASGEMMVFDGDSMGFRKGCVDYTNGFGFIKGVSIDTHFTERGRIYRLAEFIASGVESFGLGLGENTGAIIYPDMIMEVIGSGIVTLLLRKPAFFTNYSQIAYSESISADGFSLSFLAEGTFYDIKKRKVIDRMHKYSFSR